MGIQVVHLRWCVGHEAVHAQNIQNRGFWDVLPRRRRECHAGYVGLVSQPYRAESGKRVVRHEPLAHPGVAGFGRDFGGVQVRGFPNHRVPPSTIAHTFRLTLSC